MNSNKFDTSQYPLIETKLNQVLLSLYNIDNNKVEYGTDTTKFVEKMRNVRMCKYQSKLLNSYLTQPKDYLTLILDKLDFTAKVTSTDINKLLSDKGLTHIRTKNVKNTISVKKVSVGKVNKSFRGNKDNYRPWYTHKFEIALVDDPTIKFLLYISDGSTKHSTIGLRVSYNPSQFNDSQLCAIFSHLDSVLSNRRYKQIMNKANVTRIDLAVDLPGVFTAFLLCLPEHGGVRNSVCYPLSEECIRKIVETIYLGWAGKNDKSKNRCSKARIYDALTNYLKNNPESIELIYNMAIMTRIEYELIPYQSNCKLTIEVLEKCAVKLDEVIVIDPINFHKLPIDLLNGVLKNKNISHIRKNKSDIKKAHGSKKLSLKTGWLAIQQARLLKHHKKIIMSPKNCQKASKVNITCENLAVVVSNKML